jgi:hypothetical protein
MPLPVSSPLRCALYLLASALPVTTGAARAALTNDTVQVTNVTTQPPALALDPDGTLHIAYRSGTALVHAWRSGLPWSLETVATPGSGGWPLGLAAGNAGRTALAYKGAAGELITARREGSGWQPDTVDVAPGVARWSLAVDPVTDATVVAYVSSTGGPETIYRLRIARRGPSGWAVTTVDSSTLNTLSPSLALDPAGHPRVVVPRLVDVGDQAGMFFAEADADAGPWTWASVDTFVDTYGANSSLALDPVTGEPRIAYFVSYGTSGYLGYASRTAGTWTAEEFFSLDSWSVSEPSLTLDAAGDPHIAMLRGFLVNAENVRAGGSDDAQPAGPLASCGGAVTNDVVLLERSGAATPGPFQETYLSAHLVGGQSSGLAAVAHGAQVHVAWRDRLFATCTPNNVIHTLEAEPTSVPPSSRQSITMSASPNPVRPGGELTVKLQVDRASRVTFELLDVAGRRIGSRTFSLPAGPAAAHWTLPALRAGWYRMQARQDGAVVGAASLLLVD